MLDKTMTFSLGDDKEQEMKKILTTVYDAPAGEGLQPHQPDRGISAVGGSHLYHHP